MGQATVLSKVEASCSGGSKKAELLPFIFAQRFKSQILSRLRNVLQLDSFRHNFKLLSKAAAPLEIRNARLLLSYISYIAM